MATAKISQEIDDQFLQCPVCMDQFDTPKTLPRCGHTICVGCLTSIISRNYGRLKCPLCRIDSTSLIPRGGVNALPDSYIINSLKEFVKVQKKSKAVIGEVCSVCKESSAESYCTVCDQLQCSDCSEKHQNITVTKHHKMLSIDEFRSTPSNLLQPRNCSLHEGHQVELFCQSCDVPVCLQCIRTFHQGDDHKHVALATAAEKKRAKVVKLLEQVNKKVPEMKKIRESLNHKHDKLSIERTQLYKEISTKTSEIINTIKCCEHALLEQVHSHYEGVMGNIENNISQLDETIQQGEKITSLGEEMLWSSTDSWVFFLEKQHGGQLREIIATNTKITPPTIQPITFQSGDGISESCLTSCIGSLAFIGSEVTSLTGVNALPATIGRHRKFNKVKTIDSYGPIYDRKRLRQPRGVTLMGDEMFLVAAMGNDQVLKYSINGGFESQIYFQNPCDVATTKTLSSLEGTIYITDGHSLTRYSDSGVKYCSEGIDDSSQVLGVTTNLEQTKMYVVARSITKEESICTNDVEWVTPSSSECMNQTSICYWELGARKDSQHLKCDGIGRFIAVNNKEQILITDSSHGIVKVFNSRKKCLEFTFGSEKQLTNPLGVSTDMDDNVFVCSKGCVKMFSPTGRYLCRVDRSRDKLFHPVAVCVTRRHPYKVIVIVEDHDKNGQIVIYQEEQ
ncbi:uncharacterized protein LOC102805657 [Saccoglossus kowalevskii]|uniref:Uncharacterized protein LOC102805657 n=1 Tax=Saccoglossus kowalevskii TaxID=10224 RepID=A0ABM0MG70_SACKO|nr:PREDICTED: uncharacterized protein LOC102805657 [Saccoglossus kowalevskii]